MSEKAARLPKPEMRGLVKTVIKKNLIIGIALSVAVGIAYKFTICEPRKQKYAEYHRNYDIDKSFEEMKAKGVFQSC